jgi:hypothetical protein
MTGWDIAERVKAKLAKAGFSTSKISPDKILVLIRDQMAELNGRVCLHVAADISFATAVSARRYRLRVAGSYLNILRILRASYNGHSLNVERPFQFDGETDAGTTPEIGSPKHIWIETETYGTGGVIPVSEKTVAVYPMPNAVYTIHMVCKMPVPRYANLNAELPVRFDGHEAVLACVMRELFMSRDFHDNAQKVLWEQKAQTAESLLVDWENRQVVERQPEISENILEQVE